MTYYQAMKWEDPIYMLIQSSVKIMFLQYLKPKVLKPFHFDGSKNKVIKKLGIFCSL